MWRFNSKLSTAGEVEAFSDGFSENLTTPGTP